jgi:AraC-like DNA-binding protein
VSGTGTSPIRSFGASGVHHLLEGLESLGLDGDALCRDVGLARERLRHPGCRIDARLLVQLFAIAEARTADRLIGLHVAEHIRLGSLPSYLIGSQNTVADALTVQSRIQVLLLGATAVSIHHRDTATYVTLDAGSPPRDVRHLTEYCLASSCRLLRWLTVRAARPDEVHFRHSRAGAAAEYERIFGCPVRFTMRENGALLARATLAEALVSTNEELASELERAARTEMGSRAVAAFRDAVVRALRADRMDRAGSRREVIARRLGVSARTLQRRLEDEGTSFGEVLDDTRRQTALALLADPALSVAEVSSSVGYAEQFAFNKAFRRWTGRSPSAYRREVLARDAG